LVLMILIRGRVASAVVVVVAAVVSDQHYVRYLSHH